MSELRREKLRYWFDNVMSRGAPAMVALLGLGSLVMIVTTAIAVLALAPGDGGVSGSALKALWSALMHAMDPGTVAGDDGHWSFLLVMLGETFGGIFIVSALIGVITTGLDSKLEQLRKGRSRVVEQRHTVLLGWSDQVFTMISELIEANASQRRSTIAILADKDKVEMEDIIRDRIGSTGRTRIVCRTGNPMDPGDLDIVNPDAAKSIIILTPHGEENPDAQVIKTLLAISGRPRPRRSGRQLVVAAVTESQNLVPARLAGGSGAQIIDAEQVVSRLIVQTARQSGLSLVYTDLLDFGGDEIYMTTQPRLTDRTFAEALFAFETSTLIGLRRASGETMINPAMDTVFGHGDEAILIAGDDSAVRFGRSKWSKNERVIVEATHSKPTPERALILGWNKQAPLIIDQLDAYVPSGSILDVVAHDPQASAMIDDLSTRLLNVTITFKEADTTSVNTLEALNIGTYDEIMLLSNGHLDAQRADSRTLVTLLQLRDLESRLGERYAIVSEMADDRNRELAQSAHADDFIVSEKLISLLMTQVSENEHLVGVFDDLFDADGSEIYFKKVGDYIIPGKRITFDTIVEAARRRNEVAIGYRIAAQASKAPAHGIVINPNKNEEFTLSIADHIIVLAED